MTTDQKRLPGVPTLVHAGLALMAVFGFMVLLWGIIQNPTSLALIVVGSLELASTCVLAGYMVLVPVNTVKVPRLYIAAVSTGWYLAAAVAFLVFSGVIRPSNLALLFSFGAIGQSVVCAYMLYWFWKVVRLYKET